MAGGRSVPVSEAIARARALWPQVTVEAASDVFLEAWVDWACAQVGPNWSSLKARDGLAHLLAHMAYRGDPAGVLGGGVPSPGPLKSLTTLGLSASFGAAGNGSYRGGDADLAQTGPGQAFLALRKTIAKVTVPRVF
jgi:hypothetical protein